MSTQMQALQEAATSGSILPSDTAADTTLDLANQTDNITAVTQEAGEESGIPSLEELRVVDDSETSVQVENGQGMAEAEDHRIDQIKLKTEEANELSKSEIESGETKSSTGKSLISFGISALPVFPVGTIIGLVSIGLGGIAMAFGETQKASGQELSEVAMLTEQQNLKTNDLMGGSSAQATMEAMV